jgi:hypothetical protein
MSNGDARPDERTGHPGVDLAARAQSQSRDDVTVTVAVLTREETRLVFRTSLYEAGIQPVWVSVENRSARTYFMLKAGIDDQHYSPLEASYQRRSGSKEKRTEMYRFFHSMGFANPAVAGAVTSGYVFTKIDLGAKAVNIDLVGTGKLLSFSFVTFVPGLVTDIDQVDLDALYPELHAIEEETELREMLRSLPACTANRKGTAWGDPLNIVMIGTRQLIFSALIRRAWHQTEIVHRASLWKTVRSFLLGSAYRYSPISPLYVFGRAQDIGLQKARSSIHLRNHMRLWRTRYSYRGLEVYIGQISRDIGVKFNKRTFTTHVIDPDVDDTRDGLVGDLAYSQSLHAAGYVAGSQRSTPEDTHYNLTPDPYYSDGLRAVMVLDQRPVALNQIVILDWESKAGRDWLQSAPRSADGAR